MMIDQAIEKPDTATRQRWLTPQEIEQLTQPLYEQSKAEISEYWKNRIAAKQKPKSPK